MNDIATISIRRNTSADTAESLARDAGLLLHACGVIRSRGWISRAVRDYLASDWTALPFGMFLAAKVELSDAQRRVLAERSDLRYLLSYADPTGETAIRNVMREQARRG
jgi:hypothetical protein